MWNEKTKTLVADGKLVVIGVVQEQHAERAKLYKQWKQYEFPIAQDSVTGLGLAVVPVPILLDEQGYVQSSRPKLSNIEALVATKAPLPKAVKSKIGDQLTAPTLPSNYADPQVLLELRSEQNQPESDVVIGDAFLRQGAVESTRRAIKSYESALSQLLAREPDESDGKVGAVHFRLGVAYRRLYDLSPPNQQKPEWFTKAAKSWTNALNLNPNQYIWRRRIQQYGPRQMKPYPFYDWVEQAQKDIAARGETPVELKVALTKAEIAQPNRRFETAESTANPDPAAKITRDEDQIVEFHPTVVPQIVAPGKTVRVHLRFSPSQGHWNNEAEPMIVWIDESDAGKISNQSLSHPNAMEPSSDEVRNLEFEFETNAQVRGKVKLKGYALYYVCTEDDGQCLFRRHDFTVPINILDK